MKDVDHIAVEKLFATLEVCQQAADFAAAELSRVQRQLAEESCPYEKGDVIFFRRRKARTVHKALVKDVRFYFYSDDPDPHTTSVWLLEVNVYKKNGELGIMDEFADKAAIITEEEYNAITKTAQEREAAGVCQPMHPYT